MNAPAVLSKKTEISLALLFLACNFILLCWYIFVGYKSDFHSDSAAKVLLAREIVASGQYFPQDWNYVNGDLFVLFGHTFIIPLLAFMPAGYLSHAISGLISSLLILSGVWFLTELTEASLARRVFIVAIVASGISGCMAENLFGQASYGVFVYFSCYLLYFSYKFLHAGQKRIIYHGLSLFCILCLAHWSNPQRALVSFTLPLLAAIAWHVHGQPRAEFPGRIKTALYAIAVLLAGSVLGAALHAFVIAGFNYDFSSLQARWLTYDGMLKNAALTPESFLALFGGLPTNDGVVVSKIGIYEAARLLTCLSLIGLIPWAIHRSLRQKGSGLAFLASFALTALAGVLFVQVATTVPQNNPIFISRYFVPSMVLLLVLLFSQKPDWTRTPIVSLVFAAVAACLVTSAYPAFVMTGITSKFDLGITERKHHDMDGLKDFLLENGLHYGYSKFWNAGVLSVLSDEKLLIRQVLFDQGLPKPDRWLSSNRWYRPGAWKGKTFLLLSPGNEDMDEDPDDADVIDWDLMERYHCKPVQTLSYEAFRIFVFPHNLANYLPGWDRRYETLESFPAAKETPHAAGKFYDNYGNAGCALVAEKGEAGTLCDGPQIDVEAGAYTVSFDIVAEPASGGSARLDVVAGPDHKILAETVLVDNRSPSRLDFSLDRLATLSFRVWSLGHARVVFRNVSIARDRAALINSTQIGDQTAK